MKEFKKGDMVIAKPSLSRNFAWGEVKDVRMSDGTRKESLYNVDNYWYFADELEKWYDGMIMQKIGADVEYVPEKVVKLRHNNIEYTIKGIKYFSNLEWCYLMVDKEEGTSNINNFERGIGFHDLRPKQIERIYNKIFG